MKIESGANGGPGKLKTIIADDIEQFNELLEKKLAEHCPEVEVIGKATTLDETYRLINKSQPQLVILDVDFGGSTSFELLSRLEKANAINFQIIFLTAYTDNSYYSNAFKYSALQYLTKPLDHDLLIEAVGRAYKNQIQKTENQTQEQVAMMIKNMSESTLGSEKEIMLKQIKKNYQKVLLNDILYLESDASMTNVFLKDGRSIKTVELIGHYEYLTNNKSFFRISQSCIVNLNHSSAYQATERSILLNNGAVLTASRQRDKELRRWFGILQN